jgi:hypothetical protein
MAEPWFTKYVRSYLARPGQNDAEAYGVSIGRIISPHYRVIGVHHLTPDENRGLHNVYLDAIDSHGVRIKGLPMAYDWRGRKESQTVHPVALDKPDDEPGANIPMGTNQFISVWVAGNEESDSVHGLSTGFPDEGNGNYWGHHSYLVVFLAAEAGSPAPNPDGWTQLELDGLSYELTIAEDAIANAQAMVVTHKRGVS